MVHKIFNTRRVILTGNASEELLISNEEYKNIIKELIQESKKLKIKFRTGDPTLIPIFPKIFGIDLKEAEQYYAGCEAGDEIIYIDYKGNVGACSYIPIFAENIKDKPLDEILKNNKVQKKGIFHCCPLNRELVKEGLKLGFYISFAGPITFKNSKNANEIIEMVPMDKVLIETDSPYLSPEPLRGRRNDPRNVKYMAKKIAEVKKITLEEVASVTYKNAKDVFNIKK